MATPYNFLTNFHVLLFNHTEYALQKQTCNWGGRGKQAGVFRNGAILVYIKY